MGIDSTDIIVFFVTACLCAAAYVKWNFDYWKRRNIPYLEPSLPMGNFEAPWAMKKGLHETMSDIYKESKAKGYKHVGIFSSLRPVYVPIDLDILKSIMIKDFQHFVDRGFYYNEKHDPLSAHLFSIEGEKWKHLRSRLSPTFTSGKMKAMLQLVVGCGDGLGKEINKLWKMKAPVDVKDMSALFTTNVIGTCVFGLDCDCFAHPNNDFRSHAKRFLTGGWSTLLRFYISQSFPTLCRKLGVRFFPKYITDFYFDVIKNVIEHRETNKVRRNDFVNILLEIKNGAVNEENSFTLNEIAAQAFVFFLAGFETSSSTMTFAFYEMAKNQAVQDKIREEIHKVLAKHDGKFTYEAVMEMTYMNQVLDETLRKYPILATLDRICTKDYKIPGEDIVLKKGSKVLISLQGIHYDPEYYPNPEEFDPERFSPENKVNRHICAHMPFGEGPRICIGMRFGIMQAKIGIALMLKNYKYTISSKSPPMVKNSKSPLLAPIGEVLLDIEEVHNL